MAIITLVPLIILAISFGILRFAFWNFGRRRFYNLASKFKGPRVFPIIGNAHLFIGNGEHINNRFKEFGETYSSPFRVWIGPRLFIFTTDPEHAKAICLSSKTLGRGDILDFAKPLFGTGLFTAPPKKWQVQRKLIQPTFNQKMLESFVEVFAVQSKIFTEQLAPNLDGPEFEIFNLVGSCDLDMICETALGVKVGAQTHRNFSYVEAIQGVMATFNKRFFHIWLHPDFIYYRTQYGRDQQRHIKILHNFIDNVIEMRRNEIVESTGKPDTAEIAEDRYQSAPRKKAFLDLLMDLSKSNSDFTDEAIRDEVNTMVLAGNDTSAITATHLLLMLASHPKVQGKVYQELYEIYGNDDIEDHPVTPKDLPRMKYLERAMKETMRLFPVSPLLVRSVSGDFDMCGHIFPNGSTAVIGTLSLHRSEKYWPDPLKFDPDRFLPEELSKRHPYAFLGFSGGPRNCIGFNFALMSTKTLVATVLRKYILKKDNILPIKDIRLKVEILMKTVEPVKIRIEKRIKN